METEYQPIVPRYRIGDWLTQAWKLFTARLWELVALNLVMALPSIVVTALLFPMQMFWVNRMPRSAYPLLYPSPSQAAYYVASILLTAAVTTPVIIGVAAVYLSYVRTGAVDWQRLGVGFRKWGASFLIGLFPGGLGVVAFTFMPLLLLVPLWAAVYLWAMFCYFALTEDGATYGSAVGHGLRLVRINFWQAVLAYLLVAGLLIAGFVACCVGIFFAAALVQVYVAVAYDDLTRQMGALREPTEGQTTL